MITGFLTVAIIVPLVWMVMDRDPPYERSDGEIIAVDPNNCGIPEKSMSRSIDMPIQAGSCVEIKWDIKPIRNCPASGGDNSTRSLRDSMGIIQPVGSLRRDIFEHQAPDGTVRQFMVLPLPLSAGDTTYISSSCFACNPLQHIFWPVCVSKPDIHFEVVK